MQFNHLKQFNQILLRHLFPLVRCRININGNRTGNINGPRFILEVGIESLKIGGHFQESQFDHWNSNPQDLIGHSS